MAMEEWFVETRTMATGWRLNRWFEERNWKNGSWSETMAEFEKWKNGSWRHEPWRVHLDIKQSYAVLIPHN
jgi:hypothetical protein